MKYNENVMTIIMVAVVIATLQFAVGCIISSSTLTNQAYALQQTAPQDCTNEDARCQDLSGQLQGHDNPAIITGNQPTTTSTPIPGACPEGTVFDVTLQVPASTLPVGTVFCLKSAGINPPGVVTILPNGDTLALPGPVTVQSPPTGGCSFPAAVTSGVLPSPLSGTTVCLS